MNEAVRTSRGQPFLGVCVGAQLMAARGLEHEVVAGLTRSRATSRTIKPRVSGLKIPHMGWNTLDVLRGHPLLDGVKTGPGPGCTPISSIPINSTPTTPATSSRPPTTAARSRRWSSATTRRDAIPSRKEPDARPGLDRQLPQVGPVILFPAIDLLQERRCVRLVPRRHRQDDRCCKRRPAPGPGVRGAGFGRSPCSSISTALRRPADQRRRRSKDVLARSITIKPRRRRSGPEDRARLARRGVTRVIIGTAAVRDPDLVREAARLYPGRIAVGVDAREGRWRSTAGRRLRTFRRSTLRAGSRTRASPRSSIPISLATALSPASTSKARSRSPTRSNIPVSPGGPRLDRRCQAAHGARLRPPRRRHRRPRPL